VFELTSLNSEVFKEVGACFGGGTLITLSNNEYRWSKDVDFICPVGPGYKRLREIVSGANFKPQVFFSNTSKLEFPRELKANQYGIRFLVIADQKYLEWTSIPTLDHEDQCTEKLLANADRWVDSSIQSRDLIDLAALRLKAPIEKKAIEKAESSN